jgi:hypothetical protein
VILTVPKRAFYLKSSEKACAMALLFCTCHTVSHLPLYSVLLNSRRPLRPIATFVVVVVESAFSEGDVFCSRAIVSS